MEELAQRVKDLFKSNPDNNELYSTSDGQVFFGDRDADGHAQRLSNKVVTTHFREGSKAEVDAELEEQLDDMIVERDYLKAQLEEANSENEQLKAKIEELTK